MQKELYKIIKEYQEKTITEDLIKTIFDIMISGDKGLEEYAKGLEFATNIDAVGDYNSDTGIIRIDLNTLLELPLVDSFKLIYVIKVLRHEIEHAKNLQKLYEGRNDIESMVIKYSLIVYIIKNHLKSDLFIAERDPYLLYDVSSHNYEIDPGERIAEIKAHKFIISLLKNQRNSKELQAIRAMLYRAYINGYNDNGYYLDAPTYMYLLKMQMYHEFMSLKMTVDNSGYSLDTRIMCGLPITYQERDEVLIRKLHLKELL